MNPATTGIEFRGLTLDGGLDGKIEQPAGQQHISKSKILRWHRTRDAHHQNPAGFQIRNQIRRDRLSFSLPLVRTLYDRDRSQFACTGLNYALEVATISPVD